MSKVRGLRIPQARIDGHPVEEPEIEISIQKQAEMLAEFLHELETSYKPLGGIPLRMAVSTSMIYGTGRYVYYQLASVLHHYGLLSEELSTEHTKLERKRFWRTIKVEELRQLVAQIEAKSS